MAQVADDEQGRGRVGTHFLPRIDLAVGDGAGQRRAQGEAAIVAAGCVQAVHAQGRAPRLRARLLEIGIGRLIILARQHLAPEQRVGALVGQLLAHFVSLRFAPVGLGTGQVRRIEVGQQGAARHARAAIGMQRQHAAQHG